MKLRAHCLLWMLLAAGLAGSPVQADIVPALYEARVPVADQSPDARKLALQQAFATVLMRITGERVLGGSLSLLSTNASQYLQQYRYEQAPPQVGAPPLGAAGQQPQSATQGATPPGFLLWARFDAKVVNKAVQDAHAPLWGAERPTTVVWLALQDGPTGRILSAADTSFVMQGLAAAADARGLTLVFPQMDAADKAAIGVPDVSGFIQDRVRQASTRYKADAILVGTVFPSNATQFIAKWQLWFGGQQYGWDTAAADEASVAADGVQTAADRYAERLAIAPDAGDLNGVSLQVDNVVELDAYAKVQAYLASLTPVRAVHVQRVDRGSLYLDVDAHGSLDNLQEAIALGGLLVPVEPPPAAASATAPATAQTPAAAIPALPLHYRYVPAP